jgi:type VI secretion system protein ImpF
VSDSHGLERTAKASLLDRLIDTAPREPMDPAVTRKDSVTAHRRSVLRDVEWLLNTRRTTVVVPDALPELQDSVFTYGLPDLTSIGADSPEARIGLVRRVKRVIERFEPRLKDVHVHLEEADDSERRLHFRIEALLDMEPDAERVVFDTVMEVSNGDFSVSPSS